ncbi:MAG TPA: XcyI family restriction endonuclease [Armatimonadetes bacterium]|nr:XcyI family restriction endonuclease [Armatimonadota bacterium]
MITSKERETWTADQLTKGEFFHQKLHEWGVLEVARQIESVKGENLNWSPLDDLRISQRAWDKVIHRGIKPVVVFAHPEVLRSISRSVSYYRMLALVSQKSMNRVGLPVARYEKGDQIPDEERALSIAQHLNRFISRLIEADEEIDPEEFDLWRGMAAGSQAQGSWQNTKGDRVEIIIKGVLQRRLREKGLVAEETGDGGLRMQLKDGRSFVFADEPDVGIYKAAKVQAALEIKGGIDPAGVLERIGAAVKSLRRAKEENPESVTILVLQGVSITPRARRDLATNQDAVNYWFTVEEVLENEVKRNEFFGLLGL